MAEPKDASDAVPYPNGPMVPQWRTEQILRDRLAELGGRVEKAELATFAQDADGVTATLADGTIVHAAYLVGADGGRSTVRKTLGISFAGETRAEERALIGDVRTADLDRDHWHTWADLETRTARVGLCPLAGTDDFQFTAPIPASENPELTLATYQKMLEVTGPHRHPADGPDLEFDLPGQHPDGRTLPGRPRLPRRGRRPRPFARRWAGPQHRRPGRVQPRLEAGRRHQRRTAYLLDTYEEERLPVAAGVLGISTKLHEKAARGQADAYQRGEELQQLLLGYPDSSLSAGPLGGTRAPDAVLHDKSGIRHRLHDLLRGPHFTVLAFDTEFEHPDVRVVTIGERGDYTGTEVQATYAAGLALIRPDGYIACTGDAPEIRTHLARLGAAAA